MDLKFNPKLFYPLNGSSELWHLCHVAFVTVKWCVSDIFPPQGSRTIRTEEALLVTLATLRTKIVNANS